MPSDADIAHAKEVLLARRKERQWSTATKRRVAGYSSFAAVSATPDPDAQQQCPSASAVPEEPNPRQATAAAVVASESVPSRAMAPPPRLDTTALPQRGAPAPMAVARAEAGATADDDAASSVPDESSLMASPTRHHSDPAGAPPPPPPEATAAAEVVEDHPPTARGSTLRPRDASTPTTKNPQAVATRVNPNAGVIAAQRRIIERRHAQATAPPPPPPLPEDDEDLARQKRPPPQRKPPLPFRKRDQDPAELLFFAEKQREQRSVAPPTAGRQPASGPTAAARRSSSAAVAPTATTTTTTTSVHQRRVVAGRARAAAQGGAPVQDRVVMHVGPNNAALQPGSTTGAMKMRPPVDATPPNSAHARDHAPQPCGVAATPSSVAASRGPSSVSSGSTASSRPPLPHRRPPPPADGPPPRFIATPASVASSGAVAANAAGMLPVGRFSSAASVTDTTLTTRSSQAPICAPPSPDKPPVQMLQPRRARSTGDAIGPRRQPAAVRFATDLPPARSAEDDDDCGMEAGSARDRLGKAIAAGTGITWQEEALLDAIEATNLRLAAAAAAAVGTHGHTAHQQL